MSYGKGKIFSTTKFALVVNLRFLFLFLFLVLFLFIYLFVFLFFCSFTFLNIRFLFLRLFSTHKLCVNNRVGARRVAGNRVATLSNA